MTELKPDWLEPAIAAEIVVSAVSPLPPTSLVLSATLGRVLAEDIVAPIDLPRWTNSAMDGFAVRAHDIAAASPDAPVRLRVIEDIAAGAFPSRRLSSGEATRVMTGAPVPEGADSVVRVEHTDGGSGIGMLEGSVTVFEGQDARRNLRQMGEDIREGSVALPSGSILSPGAIGLAASLGYSTLAVIRPPVVAVVTSGDELVEVDRFAEVEAGRKIVSSNSYTLAAQLAEAGCEVRYLGIAADSPASLASAIERARGCDALITSAGISVGEHDYVKRVLLELETDVRFWRVRIRPGSPVAFGTIGALGGIPWFGLPGNPVSSMVTFELFARPALARMAGRLAVFRSTIPARLLDDYDPPGGLTHFVRVRLEEGADGAWDARTTGPQGSGILTSLALADGLMIIPRETAGPLRGKTLRVIPLGGSRTLMSRGIPY